MGGRGGVEPDLGFEAEERGTLRQGLDGLKGWEGKEGLRLNQVGG